MKTQQIEYKVGNEIVKAESYEAAVRHYYSPAQAERKPILAALLAASESFADDTQP